MRNIKENWWQQFITNRQDMYGINSQIMLHPQTWEASGHASSFTDPLVEDKVTNERFRADHLIENWIKKPNSTEFKNVDINDLSTQQMAAIIAET